MADVIATGKEFNFVFHKLLSPTCILKCQASSGLGSLTWRCPFQLVTGVVRAPTALEELCPLRLLAAQNSESCFCDDIWLLAIWCLKGSGIIFCKKSLESCYSVQGLRVALDTDRRNTLLGDLKYHMEMGQTLGRFGLTHYRAKQGEDWLGLPTKTLQIKRLIVGLASVAQ